MKNFIFLKIIMLLGCGQNIAQNCPELTNINILNGRIQMAVPVSWSIIDSIPIYSNSLLYSRFYCTPDSNSYLSIDINKYPLAQKYDLTSFSLNRTAKATTKRYGATDSVTFSKIILAESNISIYKYTSNDSQSRVLTHLHFLLQDSTLAEILIKVQSRRLSKIEMNKTTECIINSIKIRSQ
jgi:hypothetical protein